MSFLFYCVFFFRNIVIFCVLSYLSGDVPLLSASVKKTEKQQTRATKDTKDNLKSAITDHCRRENHIVDCDKTRVIRTEENIYQRWIMEAAEIRKRGSRTMNWDEGDSCCHLPGAAYRGSGTSARGVITLSKITHILKSADKSDMSELR